MMFSRKAMMILALFATCFLLEGAEAATTVAAAGGENHRQLQSFDKILDYQPQTNVVDHLRLDKDQDTMERFLTDDDFDSAMMVFNKGAHSQSFALLEVDPLKLFVPKGSKLRVVTDSGANIDGRSLESSLISQTFIKFVYDIDNNQCLVGGLPTDHQVTTGCLPPAGELEIQGQTQRSYTYDPLSENQNGRTLAGFSSQSKSKLHDCGESCPYVTYEKFIEYYGNFEYGNAFVNAGASGTITPGMTLGAMDFSNYNREGQLEIVKKAPVLMNVWMYVIREMEDALDDCAAKCPTCNVDSVNAWDEAVAFYTGSIEGTISALGTPNQGVLLHALADKRCENFRTCGEDLNEATGTANVNIEIFRYFKAGQNDLNLGNCAAARKQKEAIEKLMIVPLIQGTLRYSWIRDVQSETAGDKEDAEGAIFAAAMLPLLHACDARDADFVYHRMKPNGLPDFPAVKSALERNYKCLGVTCDAVGGIYDDQIRRYAPFASPCGGGGNRAATIIGITLGIVIGILLIIICRILGKRRIKEDSFFAEGEVTVHVDGVVRAESDTNMASGESEASTSVVSQVAAVSESGAASEGDGVAENDIVAPSVSAEGEEEKDLPPIA